jgi:hypothetical protein
MMPLTARVTATTWLLRLSYGIAIIIAGFDKMPFLHKITTWQMYINPYLLTLTSATPTAVLIAIGIAEIIVGALILYKPQIGASIAAAWLCLIIVNLLSMGTFFDIAIRDALLVVSLVALIVLEGKE